MRERLLEVLAEPVTGAPLRLRADEGRGDSIASGVLICETTGKKYPIMRGVPRFVDGENHNASFDWPWNTLRGTPLVSVPGAGHSATRGDEETGGSIEVDLKSRVAVVEDTPDPARVVWQRDSLRSRSWALRLHDARRVDGAPVHSGAEQRPSSSGPFVG